MERTAQEFAEVTRSGRASFTTEQVIDIIRLVRSGEYPDERYSDNECCLWSRLKKELA